MRGITIRSPAKINWFLRILSREKDGYHKIQSALHCIDLHDTIRLIPLKAPKIEFRTAFEFDGGGMNLCEKAASLIRRSTRYRGGVGIELDKHIPYGSGLGGGSSNAVAVLIGLNELWGVGLSDKEIFSLASRVDSDSCFFATAKSAWVEGYGEVVYPMDEMETPLLLLVGPKPFSTVDRYHHPGLKRRHAPLDRLKCMRCQYHELIRLGNNFEDLARDEYNSIDRALNLAADFGNAFMTGSGGALVVALDPKAKNGDLERAKSRLEERIALAPELSEWVVIPTQTIRSSAFAIERHI